MPTLGGKTQKTHPTHDKNKGEHVLQQPQVTSMAEQINKQNFLIYEAHVHPSRRTDQDQR